MTVTSVVLLLLAGGLLTAALLVNGPSVVHAQGDISNLSATSPSPGQLVITWTAPDETPTDYRVRWAPSDQDHLSYSADDTAERGNAYPEVTALTVDNLPAGTDYKIQVRSRYYEGDYAGNQPWSGPWTGVSTQRVKADPPTPPTGLEAFEVDHDSVTQGWAAPSPGWATGYRILRGPDADSLAEIVNDTGNTDTEYTGDTVAASTAYTYTVVALSPDGDGPQSNTVDVTTPPGAPTSLEAAPGHDRVVLSWDDPVDASITSYQILRRDEDTDAPGVFSVLLDDTGSADSSYTDRDVEPDTRYQYSIKARNAAGLSEQSSHFNAKTPAAPAEESTPQPTTEPTPEPAPKDGATAKSSHDTQRSCPDPTPTEVDVEAVPIVVDSTTDDYFVLYVSHDVDGIEVEIPVLVKKGAAGTTTLAENVAALPKERYRVEKHLIADPADVDGDCIDDITELDNLGAMNPVNPAGAVAEIDGALAIPDRATFEASAALQKFLKFIIFDIDTGRPGIYFMNTTTHSLHDTFLETVSLERNDVVLGHMVYKPSLVAPDGSPGVYYYWGVGPWEPFSLAVRTHTVLAAGMPLLNDNLALYVSPAALPYLQSELPTFRACRINLVFAEDISSGISFHALNPGEGYGFLREVDLDDRPNPRDIVIYDTLPNELPRVAGIISTVPQTPLSHVNLRAIQDGIPNAFIKGALDDSTIASLVDRYVYYEVTEDGYSIRAATKAEVDNHYASSRPTRTQTPQRDLSVTEITPLSAIGFDDWDAFGVKAANVAVLGTLGFPSGTVPDGFAIPFYFYDEFMKHNDFYTRIQTMLDDNEFQTNVDTQEAELKKLRKDIEDAETPQWIIEAIETMNEGFTEGINRRYRSSTNNEDLPGFNGAGLYDSKSQKPSEDEDDLAKSLKEVYASLWNFRAFTERDFHRIDHLAAAMGILVHPSYQDELVNGVAVSFDPISGSDGHYVNSQIGEDLVTNPEPHSKPEELLLEASGGYTVLATSNLVKPGQLLMSDVQVSQLHAHLQVIHDHFKRLYNPGANEPFAMEIEFKITSENILAIKQARPWVFGPTPASDAAGTVALSSTQPRVGSPVTATLTDPDGGETNVTWNWERSSNQIAWTAISRADSAAYTPVAGDVGNYLRATAQYTDRHGPGKSASAVSSNAVQRKPPPPPRPPPPPSNRPPVFADGSRTDRSIAENTVAGENVGDPVVATDSGILTYTLGGADAGSFAIVAATGQIQVGDGTILDYEARAGHTVYVTAADPSGATARIMVMITVTNLDEDGEATLSSYDPRVGDELTAMLDDPDGDVTDVTWQWAKSADMDSWMDIAGATSMSYTPAPMDDGHYLRATATYTDPLASGRTAVEVSDHPVTAGDPLVARYDANGNNMIDKAEVIAAINDYLFGEGDEAISKAEVIRLINLYLFG